MDHTTKYMNPVWLAVAQACEAFRQKTMLLPTLAVAVIVWLCLHQLAHRNRRGPRSWPLIGASWEIIRHAEHLHDFLADYAARYRTFVAPYPSYNIIFTADPLVVEHILKTNFKNYIKGKWQFEMQHELFGRGIFSADGEDWKQQRKVAVVEFSSRIFRQLSECSFRENAIKLALIVARASEEGRPVELQTMLQRMTLDAICKLGFGADMGSLSVASNPEAIAFTEAFDFASARIASRSSDPFWKLKKLFGIGGEALLSKHINVLNNFVTKMIHSRRQDLARDAAQGKQFVRGDLLSRFMGLCEDDHDSDEKLRDMALNIMLAGRDTVAITLCWFLYALHENPRVEEEVVAEILSVEAAHGHANSHSLLQDEGELDLGGRITAFAALLDCETLSRLNYLHATLSETLRLYPAVPLDPRSAAEEDVLPDGTRVAKGDVVMYLAYAMGRMKFVWGDDAMEFRPERWLLQRSNGNFSPESPFKFTAFHAGPRACMGKESAYLQMKITAAILLRFFKFKVVFGHKVQYRMMLTLHMHENGLLMNVSSR